MAFYNYTWTKQPDAGGARVYAFEPQTTLPLINITGPGIAPNRAFAVLQPPQMVALQNTIDAGMIGIYAGQYAVQPPMDNRGLV